MPAEPPALLVAAVSARALAAAARAAGYAPLVADCFIDADTRALAADHRRVAGEADGGLAPAPLRAALAELAEGRAPLGLVYGAGLENRPALLAALAEEWTLLGNPSAVVAAVKNPSGFAALCHALAIPHPPSGAVAAAAGMWLQKPIGGCGGSGIRPVGAGAVAAAGHYLQARVTGAPVSALFLADGARAEVLFFSTQWTDPSESCPFRYGGAVRPAIGPGATILAGMTAALAALVPRLGLRGLNSADFLWRRNGFDLLEINPRPGATLDLAPPDILARHLRACAGELSPAGALLPMAAAARVVYADSAITMPADFAWPEWAADRPSAGESVAAGAPFCTVRAQAATAGRARSLLHRRAAMIWRRVKGPTA